MCYFWAHRVSSNNQYRKVKLGVVTWARGKLRLQEHPTTERVTIWGTNHNVIPVPRWQTVLFILSDHVSTRRKKKRSDTNTDLVREKCQPCLKDRKVFLISQLGDCARVGNSPHLSIGPTRPPLKAVCCRNFAYESERKWRWKKIENNFLE